MAQTGTSGQQLQERKNKEIRFLAYVNEARKKYHYPELKSIQEFEDNRNGVKLSDDELNESLRVWSQA